MVWVSVQFGVMGTKRKRTPTMTSRLTVGIPYARATVTQTGRYWVQCPLCPAAFSGRQHGRTEDQMTKEANLEYAIHYEKTHDEDAV